MALTSMKGRPKRYSCGPSDYMTPVIEGLIERHVQFVQDYSESYYVIISEKEGDLHGFLRGVHSQ
jgi:hypothetical protein